MITAINFSGSDKIKHPQVIGNPAGYYQSKPVVAVVPVFNQKVKING